VEKLYVLSSSHAKVTASVHSLPDQSFLMCDISITILEIDSRMTTNIPFVLPWFWRRRERSPY
jgi:hypothetical protein